MTTSSWSAVRTWRARGVALAAVGTVLVGALPNAPANAALDRDRIRRVTPAVVQLGPIFTERDRAGGPPRLRAVGWGSGTILNRDGYILTNEHVTDTSSIADELGKNGVVKQGVVVVFMTRRTDQPPVPVFVATVVAANAALDLAVVKITKHLDGTDVDLSSTNLPSVGLGDSDALELGDALNVFGYPGIGGQTITYTVGPVSGFASDERVPGRAWIKTSTSISGGNSGGAGIDDEGLLIGVPTRAGVDGAKTFVDCRPLADTNRDGEIDGNDTCVPTGGFLNSLRAINAGKKLIETALRAKVPPTPAIEPDPLPSGGASRPELPIEPPPLPTPEECIPASTLPAASGPSTTTSTSIARRTAPTTLADPDDPGGEGEERMPPVSGTARPETRSPTVPATRVLAATSTTVVVPSSAVPVLPRCLPTGPGDPPGPTSPPVSPGTETPSTDPPSLPGTVPETVPETVPQPGPSAPAAPAPGTTVELTGTIRDASTGKPVSGIVGYVLAEGVTWENATSESQIHARAVSDRNGEFRFNRPLNRGRRYSVGFGSSGSGYRTATTDRLLIPTTGPDPLRLDVRLERE